MAEVEDHHQSLQFFCKMKFGNSTFVVACSMLLVVLGVAGENVTSERLQNDILEVEYAQLAPLSFPM